MGHRATPHWKDAGDNRRFRNFDVVTSMTARTGHDAGRTGHCALFGDFANDTLPNTTSVRRECKRHHPHNRGDDGAGDVTLLIDNHHAETTISAGTLASRRRLARPHRLRPIRNDGTLVVARDGTRHRRRRFRQRHARNPRPGTHRAHRRQTPTQGTIVLRRHARAAGRSTRRVNVQSGGTLAAVPLAGTGSSTRQPDARGRSRTAFRAGFLACT
jgi:hypothetical protein